MGLADEGWDAVLPVCDSNVGLKGGEGRERGKDVVGEGGRSRIGEEIKERMEQHLDR